MNPNNLSIRELMRYGEQHDDAWVRRLSNLLYAISFHIPESYLKDEFLDDWFEKNEEEISDLERNINEQEDTLDEQVKEIDRLYEEIKALRFDLEEKFSGAREDSVVRGLKAHIVTLQEERYEAKQTHEGVVDKLRRSEKAFKELQDKYNTWSIIAS